LFNSLTAVPDPITERFFADHATHWPLPDAIFDALPDVVFFIKDLHGRYVAANQTLAERCAQGHKPHLLGKRPEEVFPPALAASYVRQDQGVLKTGKGVDHQLELHIYPDHVPGWCLTTKHPLRNPSGQIIGIVGISRDLGAPDGKAHGYAELAAALTHMQTHYTENLRIDDLAKQSGLSVYQFEQRIQRLFKLSPLQLLHKLRLDEGTRLLRETPMSLSDIAIETGWCDQSAFTRNFNRYTGMSPGRFRSLRS
jgi:AraC-like DNA-binding protein